jgi:hypothetical protein
MAHDGELTTVFLHQVEAGQTFYCTRSETRAWERLPATSPAHGLGLEVPVRRGGLSMHMNGMVQVWVSAHRSGR